MLRKACPSAEQSITKPHKIARSKNRVSALRSRRTNDLKHDTALNSEICPSNTQQFKCYREVNTLILSKFYLFTNRRTSELS